MSAARYLHKRNIIHRDMKLENVLLDKNYECKLMDFGLSKMIDRMSLQKTKGVGTSYFMAPELMKGNYDEKVDVYAFGIMLFMIFTENMHPYGLEVYSVEIRVANDPSLRPNLKELKKADVVPKEDFKWLTKLIKLAWSHEPTERPSFKQMMKVFNEKSIDVDDLGSSEDEKEEDDDSSSDE